MFGSGHRMWTGVIVLCVVGGATAAAWADDPPGPRPVEPELMRRDVDRGPWLQDDPLEPVLGPYRDAQAYLAEQWNFELELAEGDDQEQLIEAFYRAQVTETIGITPDVQVIVDPAGRADDDAVVVLGVRLQAVFCGKPPKARTTRRGESLACDSRVIARRF